MGWTRWTPSPGRSSRREPCLDTSPPDPQLSALYQELILDHYRRPRNKGTLEQATHAVSLNNPLCAMMQGDEGAARDKTLGELRALAGVSRFPVRIKCALLPWNALTDAVNSQRG